ncbi:MAG TPA: sigma-54 dependent transcriptional regulator [Terriglobales bacterium]|nr:sigma-54 dependent transcriptional regulator [Terriglobales bacterium]
MTYGNGLVYVVDDDESVREGVADLVSSAGLAVRTASSGREFLAMERPDVPSCLILDVNLPELSGIELQQELARCGVQIPIIFLTGHGDIPMTVRALKAGAADFLTKPVHDEDLLNAIRQCIGRHHSAAGNAHEIQKPCRTHVDDPDQLLYLDSEISPDCKFEDIVGNSPTIKRVFEQISIVAPTDSTVLLHGETGTGKELVARAIHNTSARRNHSFVRMNCAAIPTGLLESELFGHEKGAFTGAVMQKKGRFELADSGSLFLDEIGDISLELQPKLLRAVQEQEFERLGSARTFRVDVRIIAATHRDLPAMIREGKFREDLFYRLNVFPIRIPPLRDRREDIPLLVNNFVYKLSRRMGKNIKCISRGAMNFLTNAAWPGNVRELQNYLERAVILTQGSELNVPLAELRNLMPAPRTTLPSTLHDAERQAIIDALIAASGRIAGAGGAAERLGLKRSTLQNKMRRLNVSRLTWSQRAADISPTG